MKTKEMMIMNKKDKLALGYIAGVNLVLSPEYYEEYKGTLNKQIEEKDKEIDRLNNIISELERHLNQEILEWQDISDLWTKAQVQEDRIILDKLKELKEENK